MIRAEERAFLENFVRKEKRERLLYEWDHPKKRHGGLERFCHHTAELIDPAKILMEGPDLDRREEFRRFLASRSREVTVLSPDVCPDGERMPAEEAVAFALACFDAVLILGDGWAVVFGEVEKGGRDKVLTALSR